MAPPHGVVAAATYLGLAVLGIAACQDAKAQHTGINDTFAGPDGLIAAEKTPPAPGTPWEITSGSLFRSQDNGWTGRPDAGTAPGDTGSAVFRMVSVDRSFDDVDVDVVLRVDELGETTRTPAQDYDGAHIWLRYKSDKELYAVSVDRRDGKMVIKKKCLGGGDNGGTYYELNEPISDVPIPFGQWQHVTASVRDQDDGSVLIRADRDGTSIEATDTGVGCAPLRGQGGVGIRGDNAELRFASITVQES